MSAPAFPPDQRNAPLTLWQRVGAFVNELFSLFGEPQVLAGEHILALKRYQLILPWLRAGEALLRRFLLLEAALLEPEAPSPRPRTPAPSKPRPPRDLDLNDPDAWRVSFRCSSSPAHAQRRSRQSRKGNANPRVLAPRFRSALPLARRFEAVLRVYNNPLAFARRRRAFAQSRRAPHPRPRRRLGELARPHPRGSFRRAHPPSMNQRSGSVPTPANRAHRPHPPPPPQQTLCAALGPAFKS